MSASVRAWLLQTGAPFGLALAEHEQVEVLNTPRCLPVPRAPRHCPEVIAWRDQLIPLLRVRALVEARDADGPPRYVAVCAYQAQAGEPLAHAAIALHEPPRPIDVWDHMASDPGELPAELPPVLLACFHHGDWPVAILDLARVFSAPVFSTISPPSGDGGEG